MVRILIPAGKSCPLHMCLRAPGFGLLLVWILVQGCAGTDPIARKGGGGIPEGYSGREVPIDVNKIPDPIPRYEPKSKYGNPSSYVVWGKRYHVMNDAKNFVQRGVASWYGSKFHGRRTSSGEPYDMYGMSAAHKTLPLPSYLQVTNLENGRTVVVRVNDRGPFHGDRILDLSFSAAKKLGIVRNGTGHVEIRDISPRNGNFTTMASAPAKRGYMMDPASKADGGKLFVQIGAFKNPTNANKLLSTVNGRGLPTIRIQTGLLDRQPVYRVQIGPIDTFFEARRVVARLGELGVTSARIVSDSRS